MFIDWCNAEKSADVFAVLLLSTIINIETSEFINLNKQNCFKCKLSYPGGSVCFVLQCTDLNTKRAKSTIKEMATLAKFKPRRWLVVDRLSFTRQPTLINSTCRPCHFTSNATINLKNNTQASICLVCSKTKNFHCIAFLQVLKKGQNYKNFILFFNLNYHIFLEFSTIKWFSLK